MGSPKISERDETAIKDVLRKWSNSEKITWESLRRKLAEKMAPKPVWTRQALSAHPSISGAVSRVKLRQQKSSTHRTRPIHTIEKDLLDTKDELADMQRKYDELIIRHRTLVYNVAAIPGGRELLADPLPLPDNTQSQGGATYKKPSNNRNKRVKTAGFSGI